MGERGHHDVMKINFKVNRYSIIYLSIAIVLTFGPFLAPSFSMVPGWHTVILPPYFILNIFILFWFYFLAAIYRYLHIKKFCIPQKCALLHLVSSLLYFPYALAVGSFVMLISLILFIIGQAAFIFYLLTKSIRA